MFFERFINKQLGLPSGVFSGLVAAIMNRLTSPVNDETIRLLEIEPTDNVLDIGFGGGATLAKMVKSTSKGLVAGIDISESMLKQGKKKFRKLIFQKRVDIRGGSVSKIPFEDRLFDKISTVNTIYFWPEPAADMKEIFRVMKPRGRFVLAFHTKDKFHSSQYGFKMYPDEQLCKLLNQTGFADITIKHINVPRFAPTLIVANKR